MIAGIGDSSSHVNTEFKYLLRRFILYFEDHCTALNCLEEEQLHNNHIFSA